MFAPRVIDFTQHETDRGVYRCSACGSPMFQAAREFESGTGFPSFWESIEGRVEKRYLDTYGRKRTQLLCDSCGLHLGHAFPDSRTPSGVRFCIRRESIIR